MKLYKEGSLEQEYLASVVDSYYGLWGAYKESRGGMWGIYIAKDRKEVAKKDPVGYKIVQDLFPEYITSMMRIDPSFEGTFTMAFDEKLPYTHKSQYLKNIRLTGKKYSNILGNSADNILMGNAGNNTIDGGSGTDIVQLSGKSSEYEILKVDKGLRVTDSQKRDGIDYLSYVEILRFTDKDLPIDLIK